jgi:hypothetical protein
VSSKVRAVVSSLSGVDVSLMLVDSLLKLGDLRALTIASSEDLIETVSR